MYTSQAPYLEQIPPHRIYLQFELFVQRHIEARFEINILEEPCRAQIFLDDFAPHRAYVYPAEPFLFKRVCTQGYTFYDPSHEQLPYIETKQPTKSGHSKKLRRHRPTKPQAEQAIKKIEPEYIEPRSFGGNTPSIADETDIYIFGVCHFQNSVMTYTNHSPHTTTE